MKSSDSIRIRKSVLAGSLWMAVALLSSTLAMKAWPRSGDDAADAAMAGIRAQGIQTGMRFLADDLLEGRGTGTRGYEIAAKYMATQFEEIWTWCAVGRLIRRRVPLGHFPCW
jgi:hypothetical protein